ncbi:MAG: hypothetical protein SO360_01750 [Bifidobacterium tsurumiense]|uniref:hypothetical protein n=1 Tax=Bifidobacterium tsurumiense TaxID=356829 RepID=UPI002A831EBD|nr:hypothetical protein [Bifidobacterium tsurumiense]MDY4677576.1 hypothetical protein [Bifidobacterium tsurumiense]
MKRVDLHNLLLALLAIGGFVLVSAVAGFLLVWMLKLLAALLLALFFIASFSI